MLSASSNPDINMSKRPGSPLEAENTRNPSKFFAGNQTQSEQSITPTESAPTTVQEGSEAGRTSEIPSNRPHNIEKNCQDNELSQLLSVEGLETCEAIDARFHLIAQELFSKYRIRIVNGHEDTSIELQLMEMEFYLISPNVHEDPYCHGSMEQTCSGCWYFHRAPRKTASSTLVPSVGGGYRGGSRKGLDLTIGSAVQLLPISESEGNISQSKKPRGGILLRSARVVSTGVVISGPSLLVDFILSSCGVDDIKTLVSEKWKGNTSAFQSSTRGTSAPQVKLVPTSEAPIPVTYYTSPRIGLDLSHITASPEANNPRVTFVQKPYRFLVEPHLLKVNGRPQTFIGLLQHTMQSMSILWPLGLGDKDRLLNSIITLGAFSPSSARSYFQHFETGRKGGSTKVGALCGAQGKGVCQSAEKLLQMFGALLASGL